MVKLIAEICQNHCGSRTLVQEMVAAAAESGADYVKMQSIFSADLTHRERFDEGETDPDGTVRTIKRPYTAELERLRTLDLTEEDHCFFIEECRKYNVIPMTTVFACHRIPFVGSLPWSASAPTSPRLRWASKATADKPERVVKVASYDCASFPMLCELCEHFDHLIISTGATFDDEIAAAARTVQATGRRLTFLHCVTSYPNTLDMCNFARMAWLRQFTTSVGWSDHTLVERDGLRAAKAAIALGARWIERHFTILAKDQTKDGPVSIRPEHLKELRTFADLPPVEQLRRAREENPAWDTIVGTPTRALSHTELLNRDYYRGRFASRTPEGWIENWDEDCHPAPLTVA